MSDQPAKPQDTSSQPWTPQDENPYLSDEVDGWDSLEDEDAGASPALAQPTQLNDPEATSLMEASEKTQLVNDAAATQKVEAQATSLQDLDATVMAQTPVDLDTTTMINAGSAPASTDATVVDTSLMGYGTASSSYRHASSAEPVSHQASPAVDVARAEVARNALDNREAFGQDSSRTTVGTPYSYSSRSATSRRHSFTSGPKGPLSPRRLRFWRWFRTLPILCLMVMAIGSVALSHLSGATLRHWLYPVHYAQEITAQAERYGLDPTLVASVIKAESNWLPSAQSSVGAQGLMQVMPETARDLARRGYVDSSKYDPDNLMDPETNIAYGTAYLASLMKATGSEERAIASYNAGPNAVVDWEGEGDSFSDAIQYPETKIYLEKVQTALDHYRELYPQGLQDDQS